MDAAGRRYAAVFLVLWLVAAYAGIGLQWMEQQQLERQIDAAQANNSALQEQLRTLSAAAVDHLDRADAGCDADAEAYGAVADCLRTAGPAAADGPAVGFRLFDAADRTLVLKNRGSQTLNGSLFRLHQDGTVVDRDGCAADAVGPGDLCVLRFDRNWLDCDIGAQLRVTYGGEEVYTRNCLG